MSDQRRASNPRYRSIFLEMLKQTSYRHTISNRLVFSALQELCGKSDDGAWRQNGEIRVLVNVRVLA